MEEIRPTIALQAICGCATMTGGMTIYRVAEDTDTHLVALMKENRGAYSESTMDLASVNPPVVAGLMGHPVPPPEGAENPVSSDEELAGQVQKHVAETSGPDAFSGAILVAHNGKTVLDQAWGMADETNQRQEYDRTPNSASAQ